MILHENPLPAEDSHEISFLICYFWISSTIGKCCLLQNIGGASVPTQDRWQSSKLSSAPTILETVFHGWPIFNLKMLFLRILISIISFWVTRPTGNIQSCQTQSHDSFGCCLFSMIYMTPNNWSSKIYYIYSAIRRRFSHPKQSLKALDFGIVLEAKKIQCISGIKVWVSFGSIKPPFERQF